MKSLQQHSSAYRFSGALYQLPSQYRFHTGAYVKVNGPHDTYGVVWKSEQQACGQFLNLIQGVRPKTNIPVVASF